MRNSRSRTAVLGLVYDRRDAFAVTVQQLLAHLDDRLETITLFTLVCLFWGWIVYAALAYSLP